MSSKMIELSVERTIPAPHQQIWDALADFGAVDQFNPMVKASKILNGISHGVGAERRCDFTGRAGYATERITKVQEPSFMQIEIIEGTMPFKRAYAIYKLTEVQPAQTHVEMITKMEPKGGAMGRMMAKMMMVPMMRGKLGGVLEGLEHFVTTGTN